MVHRPASWAWLVRVALLLAVLMAFGSIALDASAYVAGPTTENAYDDGVVSHGAYGVWRLSDPTFPTTATPYLGTMGAADYSATGNASLGSCGPNLAVYADQGCVTNTSNGSALHYNAGAGTFGAAGIWYNASALGSDWPNSPDLMQGLNGTDCQSGFGLFLASSGDLLLQLYNQDRSSAGLVYTSSHPIAVNAWHYLVVTESAGGAWVVYVDGVSVLTGATSGYSYAGDVSFGWNFQTTSSNCHAYPALGSWSEAFVSRGTYSAASITQDVTTMHSGAGPPVDTFGNGGTPVTQRPGGIAPIVPATCTSPTDWTNIQQYISWLACQIQNVMAAVLNPVITVLNWGMNLVAWFFDFSRPLVTTPLTALGQTARTRFPFSIPFDVGAILSAIFGATPTAPAFDLQLHSGILGTNFHAAFDLAWMSPLMPFIRWGELALFTVGLGLAYRKWSGGGW